MGALLLVLPLPYSVISPGPTTNLLAGPITVASRLQPNGNAPVKGSLLSLTVYVTTPGSHVTAPQLAAAWMRGDQMVIPEEVLYPGHEKNSQVLSQSKHEMSASSQSAIAAAANFLHENISPSDVTVKLKDTGGPSAGLAFALAVVAKVGAPDLFAGRITAATGTITSGGTVGAIGGIDQKLIGAARAHADLVLIPADNCVDITRTPRGVRVIPVSTLAQAVSVLRSYSTASASALPRC